jgi:DNA-directed RNA polymerase III subunit RPC8
VCLYDILWASQGLIGHGTGLVNVNGKLCAPIPFAALSSYGENQHGLYLTWQQTVEFRMIVFRAFKGETIMAKIHSQSEHGIRLKVGNFFDDIFVPYEELPADAEL